MRKFGKYAGLLFPPHIYIYIITVLDPMVEIVCTCDANLSRYIVLKVSKFRKQIMVPKLLPKMNQAHYPGSLLLQG